VQGTETRLDQAVEVAGFRPPLCWRRLLEPESKNIGGRHALALAAEWQMNITAPFVAMLMIN